MFNLRTIASTLALGGLLITGQSLASDINAHTIPASMCTPATTQDAQKLTLGTFGWSFNPSSTGYVNLHCPLPLNYLAGTSWSNRHINNYRVYYQDSDGVNNNTRIDVYFQTIAAWGWGGWTWRWGSNSNSPTSYTTAVKSVDINLYKDNLNSFFVRMYRANTAQYSTFGGIDFNWFLLF